MSITPYLVHPVMNALGWTLLHALWQFILVFILWKITIAYLKNAGPSIRYKVSVAAFLALPVLFGTTFWQQFEIYHQAGRIVSIEVANQQLTSSGTQDYYLLNKSYPFQLKQIEAYTPLIFWIYLLGIILLSIKSTITYFHFSRLSRKNAQALPQLWLDKINTLLSRTGLSTKTPIIQSASISTPAVWGFIKPVILIPLGMINGLSTEQTEALLLHEMFHIKRNDHWINFIQNFFEVILFFHPATWLISRYIRAERENCVDLLVVGHTEAPLNYAQALMNISSQPNKTLRPSLAATNSKNHLLSRIKNIMFMKQVKANTGQKIAAAIIICGACISVAWISPKSPFNHITREPFELSYPSGSSNSNLSKTSLNPNAPKPSKGTSSPSNDTITRNNQHWFTDSTYQYLESSNITLDNGKVVAWQDLSPEEKEEIKIAIDDAAIALSESVIAVTDLSINVADFAISIAGSTIEALRGLMTEEEYREAQQDIREARREVRHEIRNEIRNAEIRRDMQEASSEINKALDELEVTSSNPNCTIHVPRQEFERAAQTIQEFFQSEQFQNSINIANDEMQQLEINLKNADWEQISRDIQSSFMELGKALNETNINIQISKPNDQKKANPQNSEKEENNDPSTK